MTVIETVEDGLGNLLEQTVDHGDGTGTRTRTTAHPDGAGTEQIELPIPPPYTGPPVEQSLAAAARIMIDLDTLTDIQIAAVASIYPEWTAGTDVTVGGVYRHHGIVYRVVTGHTTQTGWEPPEVPALFTPVRQTDPGTGPVDEWVEPDGAHNAYQPGQHVTYNGVTYICTVPDNVWNPTDYGWEPIPDEGEP